MKEDMADRLEQRGLIAGIILALLLVLSLVAIATVVFRG
jgi:tetrahydromethanopterin S-methyltransferase subunit F